MFKKVTVVRPLKRMRLLVFFENEEPRTYDVSQVFEVWPQFEALRDEELFRSVHVDAGGYGISWSDDLDLSGNELYDHGEELPLDPAPQHRVIEEFIVIRKEAGISQQQLGAAAGVSQPLIARMERNGATPRIDTLLKLLRPLGKTLEIVDIDDDSATAAS